MRKYKKNVIGPGLIMFVLLGCSRLEIDPNLHLTTELQCSAWQGPTGDAPNYRLPQGDTVLGSLIKFTGFDFVYDPVDLVNFGNAASISDAMQVNKLPGGIIEKPGVRPGQDCAMRLGWYCPQVDSMAEYDHEEWRPKPTAIFVAYVSLPGENTWQNKVVLRDSLGRNLEITQKADPPVHLRQRITIRPDEYLLEVWYSGSRYQAAAPRCLEGVRGRPHASRLYIGGKAKLINQVCLTVTWLE